ncbi:hypothetical protein Dsin_017156 [Dipteronia sinensis]|uniref:CCHC-type domain-containing protein n=1 Tax=Dipteronia sinensis TaxID=43782 RepID=A0AAE0E6N5_9ROSI|nr:hypothetical protein Dsin_017156 [Dipteronia sinensis]
MGEGCLRKAHDPKQIREGEGRVSAAQSGQYLLGGPGLLQMEKEGPVQRLNMEMISTRMQRLSLSLCVEDIGQVLSRAPWTFDGALIALDKPSGMGMIEDMSFSHSDFWVQIHCVPLICLSVDIGLFLGGMIGTVKDVEIKAPWDGSGQFLLVRVRVDIGKPLRRCLKVDVLGDGRETLMLLRYERLLIHCFRCGRLGHNSQDCSENLDNSVLLDKGEMPFGVWLKATLSERRPSLPGKNMSRSEGERGKEL